MDIGHIIGTWEGISIPRRYMYLYYTIQAKLPDVARKKNCDCSSPFRCNLLCKQFVFKCKSPKITFKIKRYLKYKTLK